MSHFRLYVGKDDTVRDIQNRFSVIFPHLLVSMFRHTGGKDCVSNQDCLYAPETKMNEINPNIQR